MGYTLDSFQLSGIVLLRNIKLQMLESHLDNILTQCFKENYAILSEPQTIL